MLYGHISGKHSKVEQMENIIKSKKEARHL